MHEREREREREGGGGGGERENNKKQVVCVRCVCDDLHCTAVSDAKADTSHFETLIEC